MSLFHWHDEIPSMTMKMRQEIRKICKVCWETGHFNALIIFSFNSSHRNRNKIFSSAFDHLVLPKKLNRRIRNFSTIQWTSNRYPVSFFLLGVFPADPKSHRWMIYRSLLKGSTIRWLASSLAESFSPATSQFSRRKTSNRTRISFRFSIDRRRGWTTIGIATTIANPANSRCLQSTDSRSSDENHSWRRWKSGHTAGRVRSLSLPLRLTPHFSLF